MTIHHMVLCLTLAHAALYDLDRMNKRDDDDGHLVNQWHTSMIAIYLEN